MTLATAERMDDKDRETTDTVLSCTGSSAYTIASSPVKTLTASDMRKAKTVCETRNIRMLTTALTCLDTHNVANKEAETPKNKGASTDSTCSTAVNAKESRRKSPTAFVSAADMGTKVLFAPH